MGTQLWGKSGTLGQPAHRTGHPQPTPTPGLPVMPAPPRAQYLATVPTVLHVDPIVLMVPEALDAQEVVILGAVAACREWVNVKVLRHLTLPRQHQDPGVDP